MLSFLIALAAQAATPVAEPAATATAAAPTVMTAPGKDLDRVKCKYKDKMNTRLNKVKTCMTIAQWNTYYRTDLPQYKRDITGGFASSQSQ